MEEARKLAQAEGVAPNQLINVAVAEKLSALRTGNYFAERARRASVPKALKILKRAGAGKPPVKGDEMGGSGKRAKVAIEMAKPNGTSDAGHPRRAAAVSGTARTEAEL